MPPVKTTPTNPFFKGIEIPNEYFCDRERETETLISYIENGRNIVLKSPRRIGKSSLIMHIFKQPEIAKKYNTLFVDIYGTKNMDEFIAELQQAFRNAPFAKTEWGRKSLAELFKNIYVQLNLSPDGTPNGFRMGMSQGQKQNNTLSEMFKFLEQTGKPNLVVFDEFQVIQDYPEKAAAIIRSHIQRMNNTRFIFSGSERHMLSSMFENDNEPFFESATGFDLKPIPETTYIRFCERLFEQYGKEIEKDTIELVYRLFSANTSNMQETMNETFMSTARGKTATPATAQLSIQKILKQYDIEFREKLGQIENEKARRLLEIIAAEGVATGLTSAKIINTYRLDSPAAVQNALNYLMHPNRNLITKTGQKHYMLRNRFMELWLAQRNNCLEEKFNTAQDRFKKEIESKQETAWTKKNVKSPWERP